MTLHPAVALLLLVGVWLPHHSQPWMQYAVPESAGFSSDSLRAIHASADSAESGAIMVVSRGHVVAAWGDVSRPFKAHSVRKSLAGALYGIAVGRGVLRLDATLAELGIDDIERLSPTEKSATVRHLLMARSGVFHPAAYADAGQDAARPPRGSAEPGTQWFYNNWDFNVLEAILEQRTGRSLYALYDEWLARPLGMEDFDPARGTEVLEPSHSRFAAHEVRISARDLARFGQLYLNGGLWNGQRLLPEAWIDSSLTAHSDAGGGSGYGYLWWIYGREALPNYPTLNRHDIMLARGTGGQAVFVIPALDLVVVHRGDTDNRRNVGGAAIWSMVERIAATRRHEPAANPALRAMVVEPFRSQRPAPPDRATLALDDSARALIAGDYVAGNSVIRVFEAQRHLFINMPGEGEAELAAVGMNELFLPMVPGVVVLLEREANARVSAIEVRMGPQVIRATRQP